MFLFWNAPGGVQSCVDDGTELSHRRDTTQLFPVELRGYFEAQWEIYLKAIT